MELTEVILRTPEIWKSHSACATIYLNFIFWEPLPLVYLKVNFDGSVKDKRSGADFVANHLIIERDLATIVT